MPFWAIVILVLAVLTYFYPGNVIRRRRMREFYRRPSAEDDWSAQFPERSPEAIRDFLVMFTDAFAIREKHWRVFRPDDRLHAVYRALNVAPWNMQTDSMEYEIFDLLLMKKYGVGLRGFVEESTTLGQVFGRIGATTPSAPA